MSYCRWSSMNHKCDLYCYEHVDGTWTTHVAGNKVVSPIIPHPWFVDWVTRVPMLFNIWSRLHHWSVMYGVRRPLGGKFAGETFKDGSLEEFKETLLMLRREGYRFPDCILTTIDEEIAESAMSN